MAKELELSVSTPELMTRILGLGLGMAEIAEVLGVSKRTLERRVAENPTFRAAISKGRIERRIPVMKALYRLAVGGNMKSIAFWLTHIDSVAGQSEPDDFIPIFDPDLSAENHTPLSKELVAQLDEVYDLLHRDQLPDGLDISTGE